MNQKKYILMHRSGSFVSRLSDNSYGLASERCEAAILGYEEALAIRRFVFGHDVGSQLNLLDAETEVDSSIIQFLPLTEDAHERKYCLRRKNGKYVGVENQEYYIVDTPEKIHVMDSDEAHGVRFLFFGLGERPAWSVVPIAALVKEVIESPENVNSKSKEKSL